MKSSVTIRVQFPNMCQGGFRGGGGRGGGGRESGLEGKRIRRSLSCLIKGISATVSRPPGDRTSLDSLISYLQPAYDHSVKIHQLS